MTEYTFENNRRYAIENNKRVLVGTRTLRERNAFIERKTIEYMDAHPGASLHYAKRQARLRWARKIKVIYKNNDDILKYLKIGKYAK